MYGLGSVFGGGVDRVEDLMGLLAVVIGKGWEGLHTRGVGPVFTN